MQGLIKTISLSYFQEMPNMYVIYFVPQLCPLFETAFRSKNLVGAQELFCYTNVRRIIFLNLRVY